MDYITPLFQYAFDNHIAVSAGHFDPEWIPLAIPSKRQIIINLNWPRPKEIPLMIAHEITHVENGGADYAPYTRNSTDPEERAANQGAIELLMNLFVAGRGGSVVSFNPVDFIAEFAIPMGYEPLIKELALQMLPISDHDFDDVMNSYN